ncbi:MAG TPA: TatD family hydrolase [Synergistaceae bacterium]|nr:TatD family hydrolase [Synergistaceae bacterium]
MKGSPLFYADIHCHLDMSQFEEDREQVLERAREQEVAFLLTLGSDLESCPRAVEIARKYASYGVYAAVGIHPHDAKEIYPEIPESLRALARDPRVIAIGETGLDYYYDHSPREMQRAMFREHILWAREVDKPLVVHVREAYDDALALLEEHFAPSQRGMVHCFSGTREQAERILDLGMYLSLGGALTWKKNDELRKIAASLPAERLFCETDSPYLAPVPKRGKRNEPAYVRYVYPLLAEVLGCFEEELALRMVQNLREFFPSLFPEEAAL